MMKRREGGKKEKGGKNHLIHIYFFFKINLLPANFKKCTFFVSANLISDGSKKIFLLCWSVQLTSTSLCNLTNACRATKPLKFSHKFFDIKVHITDTA